MRKHDFLPGALIISFVLFLLTGCEQVALFPRPDIDRTTYLPRTESSRTDLSPREVRNGDLWRSETTASVETGAAHY